MYLCLFFRLPVWAELIPVHHMYFFTGLDAVGSFTPNSPVSATQQSFRPTPTVLQGHTTSNIQSSCPSVLQGCPSAIHLPPPSLRGPWPAAEGEGPLKAQMKYRSLELIDSHKKEMEPRVTAESCWGVTVCLHCFALVERIISSDNLQATVSNGAAFVMMKMREGSSVLSF